MKRYATLLTVLVLTLSLFTGCGCTPGGNNGATVPTRATTPMVPETNIPPTTMPAESEAATQGTDSGTNGANGGMNGSSGGMNGSSGGMNGSSGGMNGTNDATEATGDHMPTTGAKGMPGQGSRMR